MNDSSEKRKMFEVMLRPISARIGKLAGTRHIGGELLTEVLASGNADQIT